MISKSCSASADPFAGKPAPTGNRIDVGAGLPAIASNASGLKLN
ncbi:hypothetical protein [Pseudomonas sp. AP3_22 TE3818]|nr:hypothetical protein [Pseudomonas reinekei]